MLVRWCALSLLTLGIMACDDDVVTPADTAMLEGRYTLAWSAAVATPSITIVPGVPIPIDDCGNGAQEPTATFTFSDSTAITLQETPRAYALTVVGTVTDCGGDRTRHFDVVAGEYLFVDDRWLTLLGDLAHPHFDGQVTGAATDSLTIVLRPGSPGLAFPLAGIDRLAFTRP